MRIVGLLNIAYKYYKGVERKHEKNTEHEWDGVVNKW
jgi:hypothetical protein